MKYFSFFRLTSPENFRGDRGGSHRKKEMPREHSVPQRACGRNDDFEAIFARMSREMPDLSSKNVGFERLTRCLRVPARAANVSRPPCSSCEAVGFVPIGRTSRCLAAATPPMPAYLAADAYAVEEWTGLLADLHSMQVLTVPDGRALARGGHGARRSSAICSRHGSRAGFHALQPQETVTDKYGTVTTRIVENPLVKQLRLQKTLCEQLLGAFGLTPATRSKVQVVNPAAKDDFASFETSRPRSSLQKARVIRSRPSRGRRSSDRRHLVATHVRLACQRHLADLEHGPARGLVWSPEWARVCHPILQVSAALEGQVGGPTLRAGTVGTVHRRIALRLAAGRRHPPVPHRVD